MHAVDGEGLAQTSSLPGLRPSPKKFKRRVQPKPQKNQNLHTNIKKRTKNLPTYDEVLFRIEVADIKGIFLLLADQYDLVAAIAQKKNISLGDNVRSHLLHRNFTPIPAISEDNIPKLAAAVLADSCVIAGFIERFTLDYPQLTLDLCGDFKKLLKLNFKYLYGILERTT